MRYLIGLWLLWVGQSWSLSVVGYLPEYRYGAVKDWPRMAQAVSHLIIFSVEYGQDGTLQALDRLPSETLLEEIMKSMHAEGGKVLVCIGGAGRSEAFPSVTASPNKRRKAIEETAALVKRHGFDGVDIDWEVPQNYQEWKQYLAFLKDLKAALAPNLLSITLHHGTQQVFTLEAPTFLDQVHVMAYDQPHKHSTYLFFMEVLEESLKHIPAGKLTVGIPFYGRSIQTGEAHTYNDLHKLLPEGSTADEVAGVYFNGLEMVARKARTARSRGIAGVMIWELGQDLPINHPHSLLASIASATRPQFKQDL
eukprot:TRINITY_DN6293_c0_g1_i2.p1 TRINITY_DN6293_c0_g1~~TRINITY_DN6293_c0_g1_i2.p1  ORF type:complete len:309 (+),score=51.03 TRINITY_DN6293_c0_g1_i2:28-954(+)